MIDTLDLRPPQRNTRGMIGVPTTLTASLLDADGEPKEAEAVDLYIGGPTSASWPLPDPLGDVTKITGTLDEETGLWMLAVPGLPAGMVLLRLVVDGALVGRLLHHVGSEGSTSPTTELVVRDGAGLVLHLTAIGSGDGGGGGTVDSVARAAITSHTEETTAAHGGIVASTDPRLTDARDPKAHTQAITTITGLEDALGSKANTADLATVAGTGSYADLTDKPSLGSAATADVGDFATAAQGSKADAAVPGTRTLAGLDLTANRDAASLRTALGVVDVFTMAAAIASGDNALQDQIDEVIPDAIASLPTPTWIAHRFGAGPTPENTLAGARVAMAAGIHVLECDVQILGDGSVGLMHDATVDRTTNGSGNVTAYNALTWQLLDAADYLPWPRVEPPPFLTDVIAQYPGQPIAVEPKGLAEVPAVLNALNRDPRLRKSVIVQANTFAMLAPIHADGYRSYRYYDTTVDNTDLANTVGAGVYALGCNGVGAADAEINKLIATGKPVWCYGVERRVTRDRLLGLGVDGLMTDEPGYTPRNTAIGTTDSWDTGTRGHGLLDTHPTAAPITITSGAIRVPHTDARAVCVGEVSPVANPSSFTVSVEVRFETISTGAAAGIGIMTDDGGYWFQAAGYGNGYLILLNGVTGQLSVRRTAKTSTTTVLGGLHNTTAPSAGTWMTLQAIITPSTVQGRRNDTATNTTAHADTTTRGGYIHLAKFGTDAVEWRNLTIT